MPCFLFLVGVGTIALVCWALSRERQPKQPEARRMTADEVDRLFNGRRNSAIPSEYRITTDDVANAQAQVSQKRAAWERCGCQTVPDGEIKAARQDASQTKGEIRNLNSLRYKWMRMRFIGLRIISITLRILGHSSPSSDEEREKEIHQLRDRLADRAKTLRILKERFSRQWKSYRDLVAIQNLKQEYDAALQRHQELVQRLKSRRYQLFHTDWRSLRSTLFENFLRKVFDELGYSVAMTKTTGDQGVDLILTGKGKRIAVQAKGYEGSVGNASVQQVYAGMAFYKCDTCVVVTNSTFTKSAIELAGSVGCLLIDASQLHDLIDGRIL
jgi:hypothetical protein